MSGRLLSQALRVSRRAAPCRSALYGQFSVRLASTAPSESSASSALNPSSSTPPPSTPGNKNPFRHLENGAERAERIKPRDNLRTAHIRTWKPVANIADAYALVQAVERKYGRILEVHFLKDFEMVEKYQLLLWVVFMEPESLKRVPEKGLDFFVPCSGVSKPQHEIGLEDLSSLTLTGEYDRNYEFPVLPEDPAELKNYIAARIIRDEKDYMDLSGETRIYQNTSRRTMEAFLRWGGFAPLEPIDPSRRITLEEVTGQTDIDKVHMRTALQVSAEYTNLPNPGVIRPKAAAAPTTSPRPSRSGLSGSAVFAGLLDKKGASGSAPKTDWAPPVPQAFTPPEVAANVPSPEPSRPSEPQPTTSATKPSAPPKPTPTPTPHQAAHAHPAHKKPVLLTPEQMSARESLKEQLNAARLLQMSTSPTRRKQPKPQLKQPRRSELASQVEEEELPPPAEEKGILGKIWGLFRR